MSTNQQLPATEKSEKMKTTNKSIEGDQMTSLRQMITTLTNRLTSLHSSSSSNTNNDNDDDDNDDQHGIKIITLAGTNTGATMRAWPDEKGVPSVGQGHHTRGRSESGPAAAKLVNTDDEVDELIGDNTDYSLGAPLVNSNFQAINNSIMFNGTYKSNDPGVHLEILDHHQPPAGSHNKKTKHGKHNKKASASKKKHKSDDHDSSSPTSSSGSHSEPVSVRPRSD